MSEPTSALLQQAYAFIENDELEAAQEILAPLLQDNADNAHLWWVYTHALRDASIGQPALERVLELDPKYPGARELKADVLEAQAQDPDLIALEAREPDLAGSPADFKIDDWENVRPVVDSAAEGASSRLRVAFLAVLLLVIAGGALVISGEVDINEWLAGILPSPEPQVIVVSQATVDPAENEGGADEAPTPADARATSAPAVTTTSEPIIAGLEATTFEVNVSPEATAFATNVFPDATAVQTAVSPEATAMATTVDATPADSQISPIATSEFIAEPQPAPVSSEEAAFVSLVADAIDTFEIDQDRSENRTTILGHTLVIQACAVPGEEFNTRLKILLMATVAVYESLPDRVEAVAAGLLNCDDPEARQRVIGVARSILLDYAAEEIEAKEFQRAWQPLS